MVEATQAGREVLFEAWHKHRSAEVTIKGRSQSVTNGFLPIMQAHVLANALRRDAQYVTHERVVR